MKAKLFNAKGDEKGDIELPKVFSTPIREDIALKYFESNKINSMQHYSVFEEAGRRHSASGTISHRRHEWKGHYGKGISRAPRKTMYRRGTQFFWIGAEVTGTRGGRRAHAPTGLRRIRKTNANEANLAINSALASTASKLYVQKRYSSLKDVKINLPIVIDLKESIKTKELLESLKKILGDLFNLALKNKSVRSGKGKSRGRKYKSNSGILIVKGNEDKIKLSGLDIISVRDLSISDLFPLGRLTIYTENAIKEFSKEKQ